MNTIFAPITSPIRAGISIVRISGSDVKKCLQDIGFKGQIQHQKVSFQNIFDPKTGEKIDEVLISFFQSPKSFTGEDVAEISLHASPFILKKLLNIFSEMPNCRLAEAGEFSKRAFLNGKMDLVQAEAIPDLIAAETAAQHKQALRQLEGKLGEIYENWRFRLIEISAMLEAAIDFPDEDLPRNIIDKVEDSVALLRAEISQHLSDKRNGQKIREGLNLVILGAPNVGKSSLINFLAKSDVAIVSEIAGTTRDVIEVNLEIGGIPVKISDTAGIRETVDLIESEGIKRALNKAQNADIKIYLFDANNPVLETSLIDESTILVANKIDLKAAENEQNFGEKLPKSAFIEISLAKNLNMKFLLQKIEEKIAQMLPNQDIPLITQERYRNALQNSVTNLENFSLQKNIELAAEDLRITAREIGKITGKIDIDNILDVIFSRFCIGK